MTSTHHILFSLLRAGISGKGATDVSYTSCDWKRVFAVASEQGVKGLAWKGVEILQIELLFELKIKWYGVVRCAEAKLHDKHAVVREFADLMQPYSIPVLKGVDYARYWPSPLMREFGDLDFFSGKDYDAVNRKAMGIGAEVDFDGYKHNHILYKDLAIENHQHFTDNDGSKRQEAIEQCLLNAYYMQPCTPLDNSGVMAPNATFSALFLLRHAQSHFLFEGIEIKHLLDWLFFVNAAHEQIDWNKVNEALDVMRLRGFASMMTLACERCFATKLHHQIHSLTAFNDSQVEAFVDDLFSSRYDVAAKRLAMRGRRVWLRFRRQWRFRALLDEPYLKKLWDSLFYNSLTGKSKHGD